MIRTLLALLFALPAYAQVGPIPYSALGKPGGPAPLAYPTFAGVAAVNGASTISRGFSFQTSNTDRWLLAATGGTEPGANVGSDLGLFRYDDTGAYIDNPFAVNRATGLVTIAAPLNVTKQINLGGSRWIDSVASGYLTYMDYANVVNFPNTGQPVYSGAARVSDFRATAPIPSGVNAVYVGYAVADVTSTTQTWGAYLLAHRKPNVNQGAITLELDNANEGPIVPINPYNMYPTGISANLWIASGGEIAQSGIPVTSPSTAIGILTDGLGGAGAKFDKGIVVGSTALETQNRNGSANQVFAQLALHHEIQWTYGTTATRGLFVRSDATAAGLGIVGVSGGINFVTDAEAVVAGVTAAGLSEGGVSLAAKYALASYPTVQGVVTINAAAGNGKGFQLTSGGTNRWQLVAQGTAEGAGNTGADFSLFAYDNTGAYLSNPLTVVRATGEATFNGGLVASSSVKLTGLPTCASAPASGSICRDTTTTPATLKVIP